ncbi:hypothetical protein AAG602_08035 [Citromicrobium bathyomarinum]
MTNVKPAPIGLTESVVAKTVGDRPGYGKGVVHLPFAPYAKCEACGKLRTVPCNYSACPIASGETSDA